MKKINLLFLAAFFLSFCIGCEPSTNVSPRREIIVYKQRPIDDCWIKLPEKFEEFRTPKSSNFSYVYSMKLDGTLFIASFSPCYKSEKDPQTLFCRIHIDLPKYGKMDIPESFTPIAELNVPLKFVADSTLKKKTSEIIKFEKNKKTITFDLGKGIFIYKMKESDNEVAPLDQLSAPRKAGK